MANLRYPFGKGGTRRKHGLQIEPLGRVQNRSMSCDDACRMQASIRGDLLNQGFTVTSRDLFDAGDYADNWDD